MTQKIDTQVLVVKHESSFRCDLVEVLRKEGFVVSVADTAEQAMAMLSTTPFDVLVVSVDIPESAGVIREAGDVYPGISTIAIAADATVAGAVHAMKCGAHDYLAKPFEPASLCATIRQLLVEKQTIRHSPATKQKGGVSSIIGKSSSMQRIFD